MKKRLIMTAIFATVAVLPVNAATCGTKCTNVRTFYTNCNQNQTTTCSQNECNTANKTIRYTINYTPSYTYKTKLQTTKENTTAKSVETSTETTYGKTAESTAVPKSTVSDTQKTTANTSQEQQVVALVNAERAKYGLSPLTIDSTLSNVAQKKSEDMRDNNYFSHTSPTYGSPFDMMKKFGIKYTSAGENIAKGQKTPEAVVNAWMNSEGHRANILNSSYTKIGVGYAVSGSTTYWAQMFIR